MTSRIPRRTGALLLALALCFTLLPMAALASGAEPDKGSWLDDGNYDTSWYNDELDEFYLDSAEELAGLAYLANEEVFYGKTIRLGSDIDLSAHLWVPFIFEESAFDGCGHSITGLDVQGGYDDCAGFFAYLEDAEVRSLSVYGEISLTGLDEHYYIGGVVGYADSSSMADVRSCVDIRAYEDPYLVGGLVGAGGALTVISCLYDGNIFAEGEQLSAGGMFGGLSDSTVLNCLASGSLTLSGSDDHCTGGLVGETYDTSIFNSGSTISISLQDGAADGLAGGIAGYPDDGMIIANCWFYGSLPAEYPDSVYGIAGYEDGNEFSDCWSNFSAEREDSEGFDGSPISTMEQLTLDLNAGASRLREQYPLLDDILPWRLGAGGTPAFVSAGDIMYVRSQPTAESPVFSVTSPGSAAFLWQCSSVNYSAAGTVNNDTDYLWDQEGDIWTSTNKEDSTSSALTVTYSVEEGGTIAFRWAVSSEDYCDKLSYELSGPGGTVLGSDEISGERAWQQMKFSGLATGEYELKFMYKKDGSVSRGSDCGQVDLSVLQVYDWSDLPGENGSALSAEAYAANRGMAVRCVATYPDGQYLASEPIEPSRDILAVGFDTAGGSAVAPIYVRGGESVTLPGAPSRSGYAFRGWSDGNTVHDAGEAVTVSSDMTFTAVWDAINVPDTYEIEIVPSAGGAVSANLSNASAGSVIELTAEPDEGYRLVYITVDGERISGTSFVMPDHDVEVRAVFARAELPFADVSSGAWYYDAVSYVYENGLMDGVGDGLFNPDGTMTRAMVWAILARMDGETVTGAGWQESARSWAVDSGISDGTDANGLVTREQFATMLYRYAGAPEVGGMAVGEFADGALVSDWAYDAVVWAVAEGIITGTDAGLIEPQGTATRAQAAAMLMRFVEG